MQYKRAVVAFVVLFAYVPLVSEALTLDEIKAQLLGILERVSVLKVELEVPATSTGSGQALPCLSLGRTLSIGAEGEDVQKLQEFLIRAGLLQAGKATGYFGALTEAAVKKWQAAEGIVSSGNAATTGYGVVGPKTRSAILTICKKQVAAKPSVTAGSCPSEPDQPLAESCNGSWEKGFDHAGCLTGYQCVERAAPPPPAQASSSLMLLSPGSGAIATGGNSLVISWKSVNAGMGSVSLTLLDSTGAYVTTIAQGLARSGSYAWRVPSENTDCAEGENAFDCIEKFARCDGGTSVCALQPGTYMIRASLADLEATSGPFQIAGTAITDILKSLVGAPVLPPPSASIAAPSEDVGVNSCVNDGARYAEGTTISVPCLAGSCTSESDGYISAKCTAARWCIPQTSYCATAIADIDVNAYAGSGGSSIQSGYSTTCPQEGWRAYLACPHGGCVTGWNICRGGIWVLDTVQQTVIVGMQGPCEREQVWCGIGSGFGCVAASQCVNGTVVY